MKATIHERGNGLPDTGAYLPGDDGELYQVTKLVGTIHTGGCGAGNYIFAEVDHAGWDDCDDGDEFPAEVVLGDATAEAPEEQVAWTLTIEGEGEYHKELDGDSTLDEAREWAEGVIADGDYDLQPGEETKILCYLHRGDALEWSGHITARGPFAQDPE